MKKKPLKLLLAYSIALTIIAIFFVVKRVRFRNNPENTWSMKAWEAEAGTYSSIPLSPGKLVFVGDSRVLYSPFAELFPSAISRGISGETLNLLLKRLPGIVHKQPRTLVVCIGINDILYHRTDMRQNFDSLISLCGPSLQLMEIMPVSKSYPDAPAINHTVDSMNVFLRGHRGLKLIHVFDTPLDPEYTFDGIHFNDRGYEEWEKKLGKI